MANSNATDQGIPVSPDTVNYSYLYGMSDFWQSMFEDSSKIGAILDASSTACSEVYSTFLQRATGLSLEDVQVGVGRQIKLLLLTDDDKVTGGRFAYGYKLPEIVLSVRILANKPFLPTVSLEDGADFQISSDGTTVIFAKDPMSSGFARRKLSSGSGQIAIWMLDADIDDALLYKSFGSLISAPTSLSTDTYRNFLYGMYFLYTHGPNLSLLQKGLNLVLGIPVSRDYETVLDLRKHTDSDSWIVITEDREYLLPYGLEPSVEVGQTLTPLQELSTWVEVKDYQNDGDWWINLQIPHRIIPFPPEGVPRYATAGSYADELMRKYLKTHTFLVRVSVSFFQNVQLYRSIAEIIDEVKPSYATPIYVWEVPMEGESIELDDSDLVMGLSHHACEYVVSNADRFRRDSPDPVLRGHPEFFRGQILSQTYDTIYRTGTPRAVDGGTVTGYLNWTSQLTSDGSIDQYAGRWFDTLFSRGHRSVRFPRGAAVFNYDSIAAYAGTTAVCVNEGDFRSGLEREVPLYVTTMADVRQKMGIVGSSADTSTWTFFLGRDLIGNSSGINSSLINFTGVNAAGSLVASLLITYYDTLFSRGSRGGNLGHIIPRSELESYKPDIDQIMQGDYLRFQRINDEAVGVYWITTNQSPDIPVLFKIDTNDRMTFSFDAPISRGLAVGSRSDYYLLRGDIPSVQSSGSNSVNAFPINDGGDFTSEEVTWFGGTIMDRSGVAITHISTGYHIPHST